jgi:hypothetical protein
MMRDTPASRLIKVIMSIEKIGFELMIMDKPMIRPMEMSPRKSLQQEVWMLFIRE